MTTRNSRVHIERLRGTDVSEPWWAELEEVARTSLGRGVDLRAETERSFATIWQAITSEHPVGFITVWRVADELHILHVAVAAMHRRRGIGERLLFEALQYAHREAMSAAFLEVRAGNEAAIAMYRKHGFVDLRVRRHYYADNGEDALEMMRDLQGQ